MANGISQGWATRAAKEGSNFSDPAEGFRVQGLGFWGLGLGFRAKGLGLGFRIRVWGLG